MMQFAGMSALEVVQELSMEPLAGEGGYWKSITRTAEMNSIFFLMTDSVDGFSALHRLQLSEGWQWIAGAPAQMVQIDPAGELTEYEISAENPGVIVQPDFWQACRTLGQWTLVSCWCAPAFEAELFELGERTVLTERYPHLEAVIKEYSR